MSSPTSLSPFELLQLTDACLWTGFSAPAFYDLPIYSVIEKVSDFLVSKYDPATNLSTATVPELISFLGASEQNGEMFVNGILRGTTNGTAVMYETAQLLPYAPHATETEVVVPIFAVFTTLTTVVMMLRLYSRKTLTGNVQTFDWIMVLGYLLTISLGGVLVAQNKADGKFVSFCDKSWSQIRMGEKLYDVGMCIYPIALLVIKSSLLLFYYQLSTWRALRYAVLATFCLTFGNAMATFFAWLFQCTRADTWDDKFDLNCPVNVLDLSLITGVVNIITDLVIWGLPMPLVWRLQLYPRERILAVLTFGFGAVACIASCFRLYEVSQHIKYSATSTSIVTIDIWTIIELNLAIICASAPALRALIVFHAPKILSSYGSRSGGSAISSANMDESSKDSQKVLVPTPRSTSSDSVEKEDWEVNVVVPSPIMRVAEITGSPV